MQNEQNQIESQRETNQIQEENLQDASRSNNEIAKLKTQNDFIRKKS
jgi:hypothetical protein